MREHLPDELRAALETQLPTFLARHRFSGASGLEVTDEMRILIGAAAVQLTLRLDAGLYGKVFEIIVYPAAYVWPEREDAMLGETHEWGTVVLSWDDVVAAWRDPVESPNPAHHEFAHVLDRLDGEFDGTPPLHEPKDYPVWRAVMTRHYEALKRGKKRQLAVLDEYGAESEAEFFAVATEAFFSRPHDLAEELPDLYGVLKTYYRQDPVREYRWEE